MKKILISVVLVALVVGTLFGLRSSAECKEKGPVKISFWVGDDLPTQNYFRNAISKFEAANPRIKVEVNGLPGSAQDIETKLNAAKLSGTYPDVFAAYLVYIGTRGARDEFASLDGYVNKWVDKKDIFDSNYEMGKYKGKLIGLGYSPSPQILVYRKDYFKEAGLDPAKPPTNWAELADYALKLTKRDQNGIVTRAGLDIPVTDSFVFPEPFMRQNGSPVIDEKRQKPAFNDANSAEALQYLADLYAKKVSIPFDFQKGDTFPFLTGRSAMSFIVTAQIAKLRENSNFGDKIALAPVIKKKVKKAFSGYRLFTIGKNSKYKKESWELIKFLMSKEQMMKRATDLKVPVVRKSLTKEYIELDPGFNQVIMDYVENGKGRAVVPWSSLYVKYAEQAYEECLSRKKTAKQALNDAQKALLDELKKFKLQ
jgi:ABC-type glycerol-3-phosphate transport system substrate-binding protein